MSLCVSVLFQVPLSLMTICFVDGLFCGEAGGGQNCSPVCLRPYDTPVLTHFLRRAIGCPVALLLAFAACRLLNSRLPWRSLCLLAQQRCADSIF